MTTEHCEWVLRPDLDSREDDSCVGMGETRSHPLTDTLSLSVIFGLCVCVCERENVCVCVLCV